MNLLRVGVVLLWISGVFTALAIEVDDLKQGELNSASRCGECHVEIHAMWQRSMHSAAVTDPIFEASYLRAIREAGDRARRLCLQCHAPGAVLTDDLGLENPTNREGITCDFCHSVVEVDLEARGQRFRLDLQGVKYGPLADAASPAHGVARSQLHLASEFCAGCHQYTNEHGLAVLSTYTEWNASPQAAQGTTCQHCHMPSTPGHTVDPSFGIERDSINLHNISGGHSREQVRKAATVRVLRVRTSQPRTAVIDVEVATVGSGHSIPTGMPTRKLILEVIVSVDGREVERFERRYHKLLVSDDGKIIENDHRAILAAARVLQDNRLGPGERRVERFAAGVPPGGVIGVEAILHYFYQPEILSRQEMTIEMASDHKEVRP